MEDNYMLDNRVELYLTELGKFNLLNNLLSNYSVLNKFNNLYETPLHISLDDVSTELTDVIDNEDIIDDNKPVHMENIMVLALLEYFKQYGIFINPDSSYKLITDLTEGLYQLYDLPDEIAMHNLDKISELDEIEMSIANMVSEYIGLTLLEVYDAVDSVSDTFITEYTSYIKNRPNPPIDQPIVDSALIIRLLTIDETFASTKAYSYLLDSDFYTDDIYSLLANTDLTVIPYETALYYYYNQLDIMDFDASLVTNEDNVKSLQSSVIQLYNKLKDAK